MLPPFMLGWKMCALDTRVMLTPLTAQLGSHLLASLTPCHTPGLIYFALHWSGVVQKTRHTVALLLGSIKLSSSQVGLPGGFGFDCNPFPCQRLHTERNKNPFPGLLLLCAVTRAHSRWAHPVHVLLLKTELRNSSPLQLWLWISAYSPMERRKEGRELDFCGHLEGTTAPVPQSSFGSLLFQGWGGSGQRAAV